MATLGPITLTGSFTVAEPNSFTVDQDVYIYDTTTGTLLATTKAIYPPAGSATSTTASFSVSVNAPLGTGQTLVAYIEDPTNSGANATAGVAATATTQPERLITGRSHRMPAPTPRTTAARTRPSPTAT